jgi:hypothetical protein
VAPSVLTCSGFAIMTEWQYRDEIERGERIELYQKLKERAQRERKKE